MSLTMRIPLLLLALLSLIISAFAANGILPTSASSSFPQCGLSCTTLTNAQTSCESGDSSSWTSCFCQSALLTGLKTSGSICASCSAADQVTLSTWYNNYCNSGGKDTGATKTKAAAGATSTSTSSANSTKSASGTEEKKSWWSSHYRWVIMLIVLVIGFSIIAVVGVWLKRRHDAKRPHLYHGGSSSMLNTSQSAQRVSTWGPAPVPGQPRDLVPDSEVNSSRSTMGKISTPVPGSRTRLTKPEPGQGDVETRQV
ncbi:hypothetical protein N7457_002642 [Penicillium paradoxum]|uniref:uncharacterized protein n=1 Tax=Penicillium paradoxum TaxID=176176 RepID=UPI002546A6FF|nr:uncharacterized protein N7457_002642 [Penicillium paradoxum]KAJ5787652.1 hypothetical protein N7457_002642 [Penicillium paradoxum]